jgi:hypothetical protein
MRGTIADAPAGFKRLPLGRVINGPANAYRAESS